MPINAAEMRKKAQAADPEGNTRRKKKKKVDLRTPEQIAESDRLAAEAKAAAEAAKKAAAERAFAVRQRREARAAERSRVRRDQESKKWQK